MKFEGDGWKFEHDLQRAIALCDVLAADAYGGHDDRQSALADIARVSYEPQLFQPLRARFRAGQAYAQRQLDFEMRLVSRRAASVAHKLAQPISNRTYELWHFAINVRENTRRSQESVGRAKLHNVRGLHVRRLDKLGAIAKPEPENLHRPRAL